MSKLWLHIPLVLALVVLFISCEEPLLTEPAQSAGQELLVKKVASGQQYELVTTFGGSGSGDGQFSYPRAVAVGKHGYVYVVDVGNFRVQKFESDGAYLTQWGSWGAGDGQFKQLNAVAVDRHGNVYVVEQGNHRVQVFTPDGTFVTKWGSQGLGDGQFLTPLDIAVDKRSHVYVVDFSAYRVQKFNSDGTFLLKWGSNGRGDGQFDHPEWLSLDKHGNVYVCDHGVDYAHRLQKFTSEGTFLGSWVMSRCSGLDIDRWGYLYVLAGRSSPVRLYSPDGSLLTSFGGFLPRLPTDIAVARSGLVHFTSWDDSVRVFAPVKH